MNIHSQRVIQYYVVMVMMAFLSVVIYYYDNDEMVDRKFMIAVIKLNNDYINLLVKENELFSFMKRGSFLRVLSGDSGDRKLADKLINGLSKYKIISKTNYPPAIFSEANYPTDRIEFRFSAIESSEVVINEIREVVKIYNKIYTDAVNSQYISIINKAHKEKCLALPIKEKLFDPANVEFITLQLSERLEKISMINHRSQTIVFVLSIMLLIPLIIIGYKYMPSFLGGSDR